MDRTTRIRILAGVAFLCTAAVSALLLMRAAEPAPPLTVKQAQDAFADHAAGTGERARRARVPVAPPEDAPERHSHVALRAVSAGTLLLVPSTVGLTEKGEVLAIHTHDNTSVMHLHRPPGTQSFTLGQLLAVWGVPVEGEQIAGRPAQAWIDGRPAKLGDRRALRDKADVIVEVAGPERDRPPLERFDFSRVPLGEGPESKR